MIRLMQRILIVKLSSMGDVLHVLPAAQALRQRFPQAHLAWVVESRHAEILRNQPWLDEVIEWQRGQGLGEFVSLIRRLRQHKFDLAVDFQGLFRSGLIARLSGAPRRMGYLLGREKAHWFYTDRVPLASWDRHAVDRYHDLVAGLGAALPEMPLDRPYLDGRAPITNTTGRQLFPLQPSDADRQEVDAWLERHQIDTSRDDLVLLNPDCRREANRWPAENFAQLATQLAARPQTKVALLAGPNAKELCDSIQEQTAPEVLRADGAFGLLGAAELIARADILVTGDTGPMHLAAAVETPPIALIGATHELRTGPYSADATILKSGKDCSPCYAKRCPLGHNPPACQLEITVDQVYAAVESRLATQQTPKRLSA